MAASARTTRPLLATSRASKRRCSTPSGVRSQPSAPITRSGPRTLTWTRPPPPTTTFWPDRRSDALRLSVERLHQLRRGRHREHAVEVAQRGGRHAAAEGGVEPSVAGRSEEHTSELQALMRSSYAVFCLKKKKKHKRHTRSY